MTLRLPKAAILIALPMLAVPFLAVPAFAEPDAPAEPTPPVEEEAKAEPKKICKRIMAQAGSRRQTKVCKTREEWKAYNADQRNRSGRRN